MPWPLSLPFSEDPTLTWHQATMAGLPAALKPIPTSHSLKASTFGRRFQRKKCGYRLNAVIPSQENPRALELHNPPSPVSADSARGPLEQVPASSLQGCRGPVLPKEVGPAEKCGLKSNTTLRETRRADRKICKTGNPETAAKEPG